jgi:hypothetical protein
MAGKGYEKPNYTQAPNTFFDHHIKEMSEAEMKVVACVIRHTFGFHRERYRMSLSFFEEHTGLTRQGVIDGLADAMRRGVLDRAEVGNSYEYWLLVNEIDYPNEEESTKLTSTSQCSRPALVNAVDQSEHALKKEKETLKESGSSSIDPEIQRIWESAHDQLQLQIPREAFDSWLRHARLVGYEEGRYTIGVLNIYAREWLEHRLKTVVVRTLSYTAGEPVEVEFVVWNPSSEEMKS